MCLSGSSASPPTPDPAFRSLLSGGSTPGATQDPIYKVFKLLPGERPSGFFPDFPSPSHLRGQAYHPGTFCPINLAFYFNLAWFRLVLRWRDLTSRSRNLSLSTMVFSYCFFTDLQDNKSSPFPNEMDLDFTLRFLSGHQDASLQMRSKCRDKLCLISQHCLLLTGHQCGSPTKSTLKKLSN